MAKPVSIRFEPGKVDTLDEEAEKRGFPNRTAYLQWIINNRDGIDTNAIARIEELEERVEALEEQIDD